MRPISPVVQSQAVEEHDTWQHAFSGIDRPTSRRVAKNDRPTLFIFDKIKNELRTVNNCGTQNSGDVWHKRRLSYVV